MYFEFFFLLPAIRKIPSTSQCFFFLYNPLPISCNLTCAHKHAILCWSLFLRPNFQTSTFYLHHPPPSLLDTAQTKHPLLSPSSFSTHKRMASLCLVLATPPFGSRKLFGFSEPSVSYYLVNHKIFLFNFIPTWTVGPDLTLGSPIGLRMDDLWTYPPPKAPCKSSESKLWEILLLREKLGFFLHNSHALFFKYAMWY